jgi:hypothetical protein
MTFYSKGDALDLKNLLDLKRLRKKFFIFLAESDLLSFVVRSARSLCNQSTWSGQTDHQSPGGVGEEELWNDIGTPPTNLVWTAPTYLTIKANNYINTTNHIHTPPDRNSPTSPTESLSNKSCSNSFKIPNNKSKQQQYINTTSWLPYLPDTYQFTCTPQPHR